MVNEYIFKKFWSINYFWYLPLVHFQKHPSLNNKLYGHPTCLIWPLLLPSVSHQFTVQTTLASFLFHRCSRVLPHGPRSPDICLFPSPSMNPHSRVPFSVSPSLINIFLIAISPISHLPPPDEFYILMDLFFFLLPFFITCFSPP